jgi:transposase
VPAAYGPAATIYNRFTRWSHRGIWQRMFERMAAAGPVPEELCLDSSHVKAHRSARNTKRGAWSQAIRISRGGATGKVHALADAQGDRSPLL